MDTKEKRKADKKARAVEIHGENCVSLSRILEDLLHPTPSHAKPLGRCLPDSRLLGIPVVIALWRWALG